MNLRRATRVLTVICVLGLVSGLSPRAWAPTPRNRHTSRVSITDLAFQSSARSGGSEIAPAISGDGRYVVFASLGQLSKLDSNDDWDIYRRDLRTGVLELVSIGVSNPANDPCPGICGGERGYMSAVSGDGRYVAFEHDARLVPADDNVHADIFLRDIQAGVTALVSRAAGGSATNGASGEPSISADGTRIAFASGALNLVAPPPGDPIRRDVFLWTSAGDPADIGSGETIRVSVGPDGALGDGHPWPVSASPAISADGTHVAFDSNASNLTVGDDNNRTDVFVHTLGSGTVRISEHADGSSYQGDSQVPSISGDGSIVAFETNAPDVARSSDLNSAFDVFYVDRAEPGAVLVSEFAGAEGVTGNGSSTRAMVSDDGTVVAFVSEASDLVDDDTSTCGAAPRSCKDVFVRGTDGDDSVLVSIDPLGDAPGDASSYWPAIDSTGSTILFSSDASNLIGGDTNGVTDVFVAGAHACDTGTPTDGRLSGPLHGLVEPAVPEEVPVHSTACRIGEAGA